MNREFKITEDGSHTLYVPGMDESYHSIHGAIQESQHVFIDQGLNSLSSKDIRILEFGFGTGLNALLSFREGRTGNLNIQYHTVEKYPLSRKEYFQINYPDLIEGVSRDDFLDLHEAPWGTETRIGPSFSLQKERSDFREIHVSGTYNLVYFDAFDPNKQPELWTKDVFMQLIPLLEPGAVLVTYSAKGIIRRALEACGFRVQKIPGPPGKREMVRASYL